jgi:hypothetical protein
VCAFKEKRGMTSGESWVSARVRGGLLFSLIVSGKEEKEDGIGNDRMCAHADY